MRNHSPLCVNVSDLLHKPGATKRVTLEGEQEGLDLGLAHVVTDAPVRLDLHLDAVVEGIVVGGTVRATMQFKCRRCLAERDRELEVSVNEIYASPGRPEAEDGYELRGDELDLEPMVRDTLLLAMPLNPLCSEGCKGLCVECGQDLNARDCGHRPGADLRWEPLQRLKDSLGKAEEA